MRHHLLHLLALAALAVADVEFTFPAADDSIPAGTVTVKWKESGVAPLISSLQSYTLTLMVGGNDPSAALPLVNLGTGASLFSKGNQATGVIDPGIAETLDNGFYFQMISTAKDGGTVTNYSPRFTITGLTGTTDVKYIGQVQALGGSTSGPATVNNVVPKAVDPGPPPSNQHLAGFGIPYNKQEGPTKYAPMQPIPPTKITAKHAKPLYPTSAFTIARGKMGPPKVVTTLTASQTFKVQSMENTIAPASNPRDDMQKFLARWRD